MIRSSSSGVSAATSMTALLAGTAVMLVAALTPLLLLRIIPFAETAAHAGLQRGAMRGAVAAAPGANTASMVVRLAMAKQFTGALAAGGAGGAARALPPPPPPAALKPPALGAAAAIPPKPDRSQRDDEAGSS